MNKDILSNRTFQKATSQYFYIENDNNLFKNASEIKEKDWVLNNNRLHIEESRLFSFFKENEEFIEGELLGKKLILISSGRVGRLPVIHSIQKIKNFSILCLNIPQLTWIEPFVDKTIYCNTEDDSNENYENILNIIKKYSDDKKIKFDGILTYDDYCVVLCCRLARELNLICLDYDISMKIKNKFQFRKLIKEYNLFEDVTSSFFDEFQINKIFNNDEYDYESLNLSDNRNYIIKDINGAGKNFVRKFGNFDELKKIIREIKIKDKLKKGDYLIEEYFEGLEIDIDMIVQGEKIKFFSVSDNFESDGEYFLEIGGCTPSKYLNSEELKYIENKIQNMIEVLHIDNVCLHFEAKCRPKALYGSYESNIPFFPIEINLRLGAAEVFSFHLTSYNYNLFYNSIKVALGVQVDKYVFDSHNKIYCSSINFQAKSSGYIRDISFDKDFFKEASLVTIIIFKKIGDFIKLEENKGNGYLGWMVAQSSISVDDSLLNLNNLIKMIDIKIEN